MCIGQHILFWSLQKVNIYFLYIYFLFGLINVTVQTKSKTVEIVGASIARPCYEEFANNIENSYK